MDFSFNPKELGLIPRTAVTIVVVFVNVFVTFILTCVTNFRSARKQQFSAVGNTNFKSFGNTNGNTLSNYVQFSRSILRQFTRRLNI